MDAGEGAPTPVMEPVNQTWASRWATMPLHAMAGQEVSTPLRWMVAILQRDDPILQALMPADQKLIVVYGATVHQIDGTYLDGRIKYEEDRPWQR